MCTWLLLQASLVHISEARPDLCESFLNRLFAMLNWTLTEFTVSAQVRDQLLPILTSFFLCSKLLYIWPPPVLQQTHAAFAAAIWLAVNIVN